MLRIVACLVTLLLVPLVPLITLVAPAADAGDPLRILIYGDSITQGSSGDWTWRYRLWQHLDAGANVDFVGPRHGLQHIPDTGDGAQDETYAGGPFDSDSGAVWGQTLAIPRYDLANTTDSSDLVSDYQPDVVVALIGLNDMLFLGWTPAQVTALWRDKIAAARSARPGLDIVLVQQPDVWFAGVEEYNADILALATELDTPDSRVVVTGAVGMNPDFDTWDTSHPSATGEVKIAGAVEDALSTIGIGTPAGSLPVVENGPVHASQLAATPGVGEVTLSWQPVAGVTLEWLERRDVTAGDAWFRYPSPFTVDTLSAIADGLTDGHRYEFRLRPAKGTAIAENLTSPVVSVIPGRPPVAPQLAGVSADAGGRLRVGWTASARATSYSVALRDATLGAAWHWGSQTSTLSSQITGLVNGHGYQVRVRADSGLIAGATSPPVGVSVPLLAPVTGVRVRSPRRDVVRTFAATVRFATGYRLFVARVRSCGRRPRAAAFHTARPALIRPVTTMRTRSRALWVRWNAVRNGVVGRLAARSSACANVR